jgi:tyrosinase
MAQAKDLATTGVVVGLKDLTGQVSERVDIDTLLVSKPDVFNLMLQALATLQENPQLLGYYALAGDFGKRLRIIVLKGF